MDQGTARRIYSVLSHHYPGASHSPRDDATPFQVLILTILSAQTTDRAVDSIRVPLFDRYPGPTELAAADLSDLEQIIHPTGFFHVKARHITHAAAMIVSRFGGEVPRTMTELLMIPGVGRKTANIVLAHAFGMNEGVAVDTHVRRLAQRIGLSDKGDPERIEQDLITLFPARRWADLTDLLIAHGRNICTARSPQCEICPLAEMCRYYAQESGRNKPPGREKVS